MHGQPRDSFAAALILVLVAACAAPGSAPPDRPLSVVATTTVFADMVGHVGGERVSVASLVPPGGEVHTFDPTPAMATKIADADLVVMNGLGLDDWLERLVSRSGTRAPVVPLGENLSGVAYLTMEGATNPHLWLDVSYAERYVERILDALEAADPSGADAYDANAEAYLGRLRELDGWARSTFEAIPADDRRIVAFHDALPYFARAYGIEIVAIVLPAPGQEPSASDVASLIDEMRRTGVRAIVSEVQFSPALAETIAAESGATVISDVYDDTLGGPPIDTYEGMIRWDVEHIAAGLR